MPTKSTALITGVSGQDGRLLAERLLDSGYRVIGVIKPRRDPPRHGFMAQVHSVAMDLADPRAVLSLLADWQPDEIYHLAAAHHSSQERLDSAGLATKEAMLTHNFLSTRALAFAMLQWQSKAHLIFAASSQMYTPQSLNHEISEDSRRNPRTFYGFTKSWSMDLLAFLRTEHGLRASTAILFNHESPLRNPQFVSRKVTQAAARAKAGKNVKIELLNIGARVDWSSAHDVVRALHLMAKAENGGDYIVASGKLHSVRDLLEIAFGHVGLDSA
jgi:GDPmannose 4,6-dehydratase